MNIESAIRRKSVSNENDDDSDYEIDTSYKLIKSEKEEKEIQPKKNGLVKKISQNGQIGNGNSVITKESLILMPDNYEQINNTVTSVIGEVIENNNADNMVNHSIKLICSHYY